MIKIYDDICKYLSSWNIIKITWLYFALASNWGAESKFLSDLIIRLIQTLVLGGYVKWLIWVCMPVQHYQKFLIIIIYILHLLFELDLNIKLYSKYKCTLINIYILQRDLNINNFNIIWCMKKGVHVNIYQLGALRKLNDYILH